MVLKPLLSYMFILWYNYIEVPVINGTFETDLLEIEATNLVYSTRIRSSHFRVNFTFL